MTSLVFLLLTSNRFYSFCGFSIVDFEQVHASWVKARNTDRIFIQEPVSADTQEKVDKG